MKQCFICGQTAAPIDRHHIFGAALRPKSEKYGLVVYLCRDCHTGTYGVHNNADLMLQLHKYGQRLAMQENNWSIEDFRKEFYKNYLEDNK